MADLKVFQKILLSVLTLVLAKVFFGIVGFIIALIVIVIKFATD